MTPSHEFLFSIFAFDAYSRAHDPRIEITGNSNLAKTTVLDQIALGIDAPTLIQ